MGDKTPFYLKAISEHSAGLADAAEQDLSAPIAHCPGWDMAALVAHVTEVHSFWSTIAAEQLEEPPGDERTPPPPPREELIETFRNGAAHIVDVLGGADQSAPVWTWAPSQKDIAFITRHQVQEAAVHHFDAAHAVGRSIEMDPELAADAVEEFLTFSLSTESDPADPPRQPLDGSFDLVCSDTGDVFHVTDGSGPGTVAYSRDRQPASSAVSGDALSILLFLYSRVELDISGLPAGLIDRFRKLCFTD